MTGTGRKRLVALGLGLVGPWGIGHYYLGQPRRAVGWFLGPTLVLVLGVVMCPALGDALGYRRLEELAVGFLVVAWGASVVDAVRLARADAPDVPGLYVAGYWVAGLVASQLVVALPVRALALEAFRVPSASMMPAILPGDRVMVDKVAGAARRPTRGEVIVFRAPENPETTLVKRVIAVGGDTVVVRDGRPSVNGTSLPRCFVGMAHDLAPGSKAGGPVFLEHLDGQAYLTFFDMSTTPASLEARMRVPDGQVWVLSDNRNSGEDSRTWFGGRGAAVPLDHVVGRALFRYWSDDEGKPEPARSGTRVRDVLLPPKMADLAPGLARCLAEKSSGAVNAPPPAHS